MKRRSWKLFLPFAWIIAVPQTTLPQGCALPSSFLLSKVPAIQQQAQFWCWAASSQMVFAFLSVSTQQCDMATQRFSTAATPLACCPAPANCNDPTQFDQCNAESIPFTNGLTFTKNPGTTLTFARITQILACDKSPIIVKRTAVGAIADGHYIVIVGFKDLNPAGAGNPDPQKQQLQIIDPDCLQSLSTQETLTYDYYQSNPIYLFSEEQYDYQKQSH